MTCPVCQGQLLPLRFAWVAMALQRCSSCGLVYNAERSQHISEPVDSFSESFFESFGNHELMFQTEVTRLMRYMGVSSLDNLTLVDVGCGRGLFLKFVRRYGAQVIGVEANTHLLEKVNQDGIVCFPSLEAALATGLKADVVYCSHTLEHFLDPKAALSLMSSLLKDVGVLNVTVPCLNPGTLQLERTLGMLGARHGWGLFYPEHMTYFSKATLLSTLERAGFDHFRVYPGVLGENLLHKMTRHRAIVRALYHGVVLPLLWIFSPVGLTPNINVMGRIFKSDSLAP